jgi:hypothetical protein
MKLNFSFICSKGRLDFHFDEVNSGIFIVMITRNI